MTYYSAYAILELFVSFIQERKLLTATREFQNLVKKQLSTAYGEESLFSSQHADYISEIIHYTNGEVETLADYLYNTYPTSYGIDIARNVAIALVK